MRHLPQVEIEFGERPMNKTHGASSDARQEVDDTDTELGEVSGTQGAGGGERSRPSNGGSPSGAAAQAGDALWRAPARNRKRCMPRRRATVACASRRWTKTT